MNDSLRIPVHVVDAFTAGAFQGNPAAVCVLDREDQVSSRVMQLIAAEMKHSETAFVVPETGSLRWFTPAAEVDLCGHATVAAALVLKSRGLAAEGDRVEFSTRSGRLSAELLTGGRIQLDFPSTPPEPIEPDSTQSGLFPDAVFFGRSRFDLLVELPDSRAVRDYSPDFSQLAAADCRGVIITAESPDESWDFVSRFFAPAVGVDEDPVTGSAHCCLTPYWGEKLQKREMNARQVSSRGGHLELVWQGERVKLIGTAIEILKGNLTIPVENGNDNS